MGGKFLLAQSLSVTFQFYEAVAANNQTCTFQKTGGTLRNLGNVLKWTESYSADRVAPLRAERRTATIKLTANGVIYADPALDLAARRAALLLQKQQLVPGEGLVVPPRDTWPNL